MKNSGCKSGAACLNKNIYELSSHEKPEKISMINELWKKIKA